MSRLYTYLPKDNTALIEGLLSTALSDKGFEKYRGRTGKYKKEDVLKVLDSWEPEWTRSKAISALTEPIPPDAADDFQEFARNRSLYSFSTKDLIKAKILAHIRRARKGGGTDPVDEVRKERPNWHRKKKRLLFQGVPHYFVETTGGRIPPEFVREEKKASDKSDRLAEARAFVAAVKKMALKRKLNMFLVTDGASGILNNGNPAVRNAREAQIRWELEHGDDPYEDWEKKAQAFSQDGKTVTLSRGQTPSHVVRAYNKAHPSSKITVPQFLQANGNLAATKFRAGKAYNMPTTTPATAVPAKTVAAPARPAAPAARPVPTVPVAPVKPVAAPVTGPLGFRQHNPGNLRSDGKTLWQGASGVPAAGKFLTFKDPYSGVRAMSRVIRNYGKLHKIDTLRGVVNRYAPAVENNQKAYMSAVSKSTGFKPDDKINLTNEAILQKLVPAMGSYEIGPRYFSTYDPSMVSNAVSRAVSGR